VKTFVGVCGLFALVLTLGGVYWWGWSEAQGWAYAVVPFVADKFRLSAALLVIATFLYLAMAVTLLVKALEGSLRAPVKCVGFGLLGLAIAFGGFVLLTANGGINGHGSLVWVAQIMFCFMVGSCYAVSSMLVLALTGWYAVDNYLKHQRQLALSRGMWN
jgi:hypothetical protein